MILRPLAIKAAAVAAIIIGVLALVHQCQDAYRHQGVQHVQLIHDKAAVAKAETVYVHDRATVARARAAYHATVTPFVVSTNPGVRPVVVAADAAINADSQALADCDALVAAKDSLIHDLSQKKPEPWVSPYVEGLLGLTAHDAIVRGGVTTRPVLAGWQLEVAAEATPHAGLYAGFRKTF